VERIAIEDVWDIADRRAKINALNVEDIIWTLDGKELIIKPEVIEQWQFTGLNTCDFITTSYWQQGVGPEILREAGLDNGVEADKEV